MNVAKRRATPAPHESPLSGNASAANRPQVCGGNSKDGAETET
jgi:hypothetical protein